jgi:hypothetical protein
VGHHHEDPLDTFKIDWLQHARLRGFGRQHIWS